MKKLFENRLSQYVSRKSDEANVFGYTAAHAFTSI